MVEFPVVMRGFMGWSNKRGGVEFYTDHAGRFRDRPGHAQWGDLIAWHLEELGASEGTNVLVVAVGDRFTTDEQMEAAERAVRAALETTQA